MLDVIKVCDRTDLIENWVTGSVFPSGIAVASFFYHCVKMLSLIYIMAASIYLTHIRMHGSMGLFITLAVEAGRSHRN